VKGCFVPINARTGAIGAFLLCCLSLSCKESAIFVFAGDSSYRLGLHRAVWDTWYGEHQSVGYAEGAKRQGADCGIPVRRIAERILRPAE